MISDNGFQLLGTERELRNMIEGLDTEKFQEFSAEKGMRRKFTTLATPHNGCVEASVKSCKIALKKPIGEQILTPLELQTCLVEVANLVLQWAASQVIQTTAHIFVCTMLLRRASSRVPQGPFRHPKNPQQSGVCPENRSMCFGHTGQEMCFLHYCLRRSGMKKNRMFELMTLC